jgi:hypothetical protein
MSEGTLFSNEITVREQVATHAAQHAHSRKHPEDVTTTPLDEGRPYDLITLEELIEFFQFYRGCHFEKETDTALVWSSERGDKLVTLLFSTKEECDAVHDSQKLLIQWGMNSSNKELRAALHPCIG